MGFIPGYASLTLPGGLNTQLQFNDTSAFGGIAGATYNKTTSLLTFGAAKIKFYDAAVSSIGTIDASHVSGLNDIQVRGVNGGIVDYSIRIRIESANRFSWSSNGGSSYVGSGGYDIAMTGGWQDLTRDDLFITGLQIKFPSGTGYTATDYWDFTFNGDRNQTFYDEDGVARTAIGVNEIGFFDYQGLNVNSWIGKYKSSTFDRILAFNILTGGGTNTYRFHGDSLLFTCIATDFVATLWKTYGYPLMIRSDVETNVIQHNIMLAGPANGFLATTGLQVAVSAGGLISSVYGLSTFSPTSGNADFVELLVAPIINQTGSSSGNYTVLRIAPYEQSIKGNTNRLVSLGTRNGSDVYTELAYFDTVSRLTCPSVRSKIEVLTSAVSDDDRYITAVDMKVGAYSLANTTTGDDLARNLIVTHSTQGGTTDTLGTLTIVGLDADGGAQSESIIPSADTTVLSTKYYSSITSITGVAWAIDAGGTPAADHIKVGFSTKIMVSVVQCKGSFLRISEANTVLLPAIAVGYSLIVDSIGANAVIVDPNDDDRIILDGVAGGNGKKITSASGAGDFVSFIGDSADGWTILGKSGSWTMET
jgi:hypothetical protein